MKPNSELHYQQGKSLLEFEHGNNTSINSTNIAKNGINGTSHTVVEMSEIESSASNLQDFKSQFSHDSKVSFYDRHGSIGENKGSFHENRHGSIDEKLHKIGKKPAIMLRVPEDTEGK